MDTSVTEIAPDVYRLSTYVSAADIVFNQFLVDAEEPLLYHTGMRGVFPLVREAVERGEVSSARYESYLKLRAELEESAPAW